jgi:hypothetical protein
MQDRSPARAILGGALVVVLSGVAAYVGASLAGSGTPPAAPPREPPRATTGEWNDRRTNDLERRVELVEEMARTALDLARAKAGTEPAKPAGPAEEPAPSESGGRRPDAAEPPAPAPNDGPDSQMEALKAIARSTAKARVVHRMNLFTDATEEGIAARRAQALSEARALLHVYALKGETAQNEVRGACQELYDKGAREVGPLVHDGLEKADIGMVKERLAGIYADTDRRLRPLFDEETWKLYESAAAGLRKADGEILDEFEKARLGK